MKRFFLTILTALSGLAVSAQGVCEPPVYRFNSMSASGNGAVNSTYTFSQVLSSTNAVVTITKLQNASISNANVDVSSPFPYAWQPFITFPNARSLSTDTSYVEFKVQFKSTAIGNPLQAQSCMAMTIVDCDGSGNNGTYREMVKVSLPGIPMGVSNSTISVFQDARWILFKSGPAQFSNIDTNNLAAMGQMNFNTNTNTFFVRVGVVGAISANTTRQFSFYFKSFALPVALPVHLSNFTAQAQDGFVKLNWTASDEVNLQHYEVYRSYDGVNYQAQTQILPLFASNLSQYQWMDYATSDSKVVYYKLKMTDRDGKSAWSFINQVDILKEAGNAMTLYPNPSKGLLQIETNYQGEAVELRILDIYGKCVYQDQRTLNSDLLELDLSDLSPGVYTVRILADDQMIASAKWLKI